MEAVIAFLAFATSAVLFVLAGRGVPKVSANYGFAAMSVGFAFSLAGLPKL
jgi:hypothetical protein